MGEEGAVECSEAMPLNIVFLANKQIHLTIYYLCVSCGNKVKTKQIMRFNVILFSIEYSKIMQTSQPLTKTIKNCFLH